MGASSTNALPRTGKMVRAQFVAEARSQSSTRNSPKPDEIEALSIQMFVARLPKNQDKFLVRNRPHLSPRKVANEAIAMVATLNNLARSQGPPFEVLADLAVGGPDVRKIPKGKEEKTTNGTDDTTALAPSLQRRRHGAHAAGTISRSGASQSIDACTASYFFEFFLSLVPASRCRRLCPTDAFGFFLHS